MSVSGVVDPRPVSLGSPSRRPLLLVVMPVRVSLLAKISLVFLFLFLAIVVPFAEADQPDAHQHTLKRTRPPQQLGGVAAAAYPSQPSVSAHTTNPKALAVFPVAGEQQLAMDFDGVDDYVLVRTCKGLPTATISVGAWVHVSKHKAYNRVMSHEWVNWGWNLYVDGNGVVRFGIGQDNKDFAAGKLIYRGRWHFVVGVYDGAHIQVYVDGIPGTKTELAAAVLDGDGYLSIGGAEWDPFHGVIDSPRIFRRAVTQSEVIRMMYAPLSGNEVELVGSWTLDEGFGQVVHDTSPLLNHAMIGPGKRVPTWVISTAPVRTYCVAAGSSLTLDLVGVAASPREARAFVTSLPSRGGSLHHAPDGGVDASSWAEIAAVPQEVRGSNGMRVVYTAGKLAGGEGELGDGSYCDTVKFRVHDGEGSSTNEAELQIDVVPDAAACTDDDGAIERYVSRRPCWRVRTNVPRALAKPAPPLISVLVPLYNQPDDLPHTVQSMANQTDIDPSTWEMVIVDDGSTDEGRSNAAARTAVEEMRGRGFNIRLVEKQNGGLADARNAAVRAARGEWYLPLDSDDLLDASFLSKALKVLADDPKSVGTPHYGAQRGGVNLVIADLRGFGAWEYSWRLPVYDALELRHTNMFHCSALYHKSLFAALDEGYPPDTLFGYEDWAMWIGAEDRVDIRPHNIKEELFHYRIRETSMHQSLLQHQEFSLASVRMLYPHVYPAELLVSSHDKFLSREVPERVHRVVAEKVKKFPYRSMPRLMSGLLHEAAALNHTEDSEEAHAEWESALADYAMADDCATHNDWQPRFRRGLLLQRMRRFSESNSTLTRLFADFTNLAELYASLPLVSIYASQFATGPVITDPDAVST